MRKRLSDNNKITKRANKKIVRTTTYQPDLETVRHSLSHILAMAVLEKFPQAKLGVGPAIENGFYYDFLLPKPIEEKDLSELEMMMKEILGRRIDFKKKVFSFEEAEKIFKKSKQNFKIELIKDLKKFGTTEAKEKTRKKADKASIYESEGFVDLCAGPHVANTSLINPDAFKLEKISGAYWRGNEKNPMLTRIYGLAFKTKSELEEYIKLTEEAKKRDHRKLGQDLDLFHIDEEVGLGLGLWHPKGAMLWRVIEDFWFKEHLKNGYQLVRTPHIGNRRLWEKSGHWGFYNSSMFPPLEAGQSLEEQQKKEKVAESEQYLLKPMNCPFHIKIYQNRPHSYRELPFRWAETGTVYRFEKKGELSGLTRVRGFTQDDAHIICQKDQVEEELKKVIDFILFIYRSFGFSEKTVKVYLSLRDPKNKKKYAGNDAGWKFTESVLRKIAKEKNLDFKEELGEAAFYGPKLDFKIKDALNRQWQCSTLQFDFNLPEKFDLSFINSKGKEERPYMLHRALFGSFERFIGLLIEHYGGALPFWLSPVQIKILPVSERHQKKAEELKNKILENGFRAEIANPEETLGKRIREAETEKIPYILVFGDEEIQNEKLSIRERGNKELKKMTEQEFLEECLKMTPKK